MYLYMYLYIYIYIHICKSNLMQYKNYTMVLPEVSSEHARRTKLPTVMLLQLWPPVILLIQTSVIIGNAMQGNAIIHKSLHTTHKQIIHHTEQQECQGTEVCSDVSSFALINVTLSLGWVALGSIDTAIAIKRDCCDTVAEWKKKAQPCVDHQWCMEHLPPSFWDIWSPLFLGHSAP